VTWVDSFAGRVLDLEALGAVCRRAGVLLVANASQALGARPIDVSRTPVDAVVSCGYKWLCGPYGTGFAWLHPDLLAQLAPQQAYWLAMHAGRGLDQMRDTTLRVDLGVRAFDVFCPANFLDVLPWTASLQLLLDTGVDAIARWDQHLIDHFIKGLDQNRYRLLSPTHGTTRSTLVVLTDTIDNGQNRHRQLTEAGIDTAYREGNVRLSVHLFNTTNQIDRVLETLNTPKANWPSPRPGPQQGGVLGSR
jgi:selenocysteine lyase/cysteine desulfurase